MMYGRRARGSLPRLVFGCPLCLVTSSIFVLPPTTHGRLGRASAPADLLHKGIRKAILRLLKEEGQQTRKQLRKTALASVRELSASKQERREAFTAVLSKLIAKEKAHVLKGDDDVVILSIKKEKTDKEEKRKEGKQDEAAKNNHEDEAGKVQTKGRKRKAAEIEEAGAAGRQDAGASSSKKVKKVASHAAPANEEPAVAHGDNAGPATASTSAPAYPPAVPRKGSVSLLLFYAYCVPPMSKAGQDAAIAHCYATLSRLKVTGRLRVAREGFNATLTGSREGIQAFTQDLRKFDPATFSETDFKIVHDQPDNHLLKELKVWPVTEIVTYGFDTKDAPLDMRGTHLPPEKFHEAMANPNSIMIDVRNFNETLIGKFAPPAEGAAEKVLDPCMRRSTEFPKWVDENKHKLEGKQVLMYCTGGVRCERASAFMRKRGVQNVFQLEGGIHRYLDAFPEDGGFWVGKNYTFDKRFSHGAAVSEVVSTCVACNKPWDRYQAQKKCANAKCGMEVLVCKDCQRAKPPPPNHTLFCPLCKPAKK